MESAQPGCGTNAVVMQVFAECTNRQLRYLVKEAPQLMYPLTVAAIPVSQ